MLKVLRPFAPDLGNNLELMLGDEIIQEQASTTPTYYFQAREFAEVIRNNIAIRTPASDGVANMRIVDDVYRASGMSLRGDLQ